MTHTGEKPYSCIHCDKRISVSQIEKRHEMTHTREKPYLCIHCDKKFSVSQIERRHEISNCIIVFRSLSNDFFNKYFDISKLA